MRRWVTDPRALLVVFAWTGCARDEFSREGEGEGDACANASVRCGEEVGTFDICREGIWEPGGSCGESCSDGKCTGEDLCTPNEVQCTEDGTRLQCNSIARGWEYPALCPVGQSCWDGECRPQVCSPNSLVCDDNVSGQCDAIGSSYKAMEECPELCFPGRGCQTYCAVAEDQHTSEGCVFYPLDTDVGDPNSDDIKGYNIMVANPSTTNTAVVTLDVRTSSGTWTPYTTSTIGPQESVNWLASCQSACNPAMVTLGPDRHPEGSGVFTDKAFRVTSDRPIVVYQLNSDDYAGAGFSPAASIVLPVGSIDRQYMAITWPVCASGFSDNAYVSIVASEDDTDVEIRIGQLASTAAGTGVPAMAPGESGSFTLDEGVVLQLSAPMGGADLTGTYVEASKPITVYSGNEDVCPGGVFAQDSIMEAMLPLAAWSTEYAAAAAPWNAAYYTTRWRVVASQDDTTVNFENLALISGVPAGPETLNEGQFVDFTSVGSASNPGEFFISADKPIQPVQIIQGQTAMLLSVPIAQFLPAYVFLTTPGYYNEQLTITRIAGTEVTVDGTVPSGVWFPAGGADDWEVQQVTMATDATHVVESTALAKGQGVGISVSGNGGSCSFAYIGGLSQERLNPIGSTVVSPRY